MITKGRMKEFAKLKQSKYRNEKGLFLIEGEKLVREWMEQNPKTSFEALLGDVNTIQSRLILEHPQFTPIAPSDLERISTQSSPDKVVLIVPKSTRLQPPKQGWFFYLDGVQDPGNVGAIFRIAEWFGFSGIILGPGCADPLNPKAIRGSMGSSLRVPFADGAFMNDLVEDDFPVFVADMQGEDCTQMEFPKNGIIGLGSEGPGVGSDLKSWATQTIHIPRKGGGESLNVSVAAGIIASQL